MLLYQMNYAELRLVLFNKRNKITKIILNFRRWGLERLTFCNKFYENPLIYKKVIEVLKFQLCESKTRL